MCPINNEKTSNFLDQELHVEIWLSQPYQL